MRWYKILATSLLLLLSISNAVAQQETFSKRYNLGANNLVFRSVLPMDDNFLVVGPVFGDEPFVYNGTQLVVFSQSGNLLDSSRLALSDSRLEGWGTQATLGNNSNDIFFTGVNYDRGSSFFIGKYSEENYNPYYSVYRNPDFPASDFTFSAGVLTGEENMFLYGGVERPESAVNGQRPVILEFNSGLEFVDTTYFSCSDPFTCQFRDLVKRRNGGYWGVLDVGEQGVMCEPIERFELLRLDEEFNVIDTYTSPDGEAWHEGRVYEDEYGDVYLQLAEIEYQNFVIDPDDCFSTLRLSPRLMKLDSNLNRVWMKNLNRQVDSSGAYSGIAEILPASNGLGMVAVSSQWNKRTHLAHLIRFDTAGNKLWHRTYGFFDTTETSVLVYDAKVANDGGYVLVGEVKVERTQENFDLGRFPTQQGWIMKVDEEGCLIPGCGSETVITTVRPGERLQPRVTLYPNPVENMLMFSLKDLRGIRSVSGVVHDAGGRLIRSVPERRVIDDTTLMLDVDALKAGIYFLRLQFNDGQIVSKKFVKR